jgi:AraC family transcriptional regulator
MSEMDVRIVRLEPMRVAAVLGFGESPENLAWDKMTTWLNATRLLDDGQSHRFFGFNNPSPSAGSPNYGYEVWVNVDETVQVEGEVTVKNFPGGLYAVTRCKGVETIFPTWQQLARWGEESRYHGANHQWLEEHISTLDGPLEELLLDLYLPIAE